MNYDALKQAIYLEYLSPGSIFLLLGVAFVLGAIHALGPGHGKSLMAAYLVGTSGRIRDVLVLGFAITISHVFSVVVLGLVALWLEDFFVPGTVSLYFSLGSGLLIVLIGLWLLISRWRIFRKGENRLKKQGQKQLFHPNKEEHAHSPFRPVDSGHSHPGEAFLSPGHQYDHHHHHHFDRRLSLWENIVLGISGGIVPCPKALVILLLAISLQKIALGLAIISVFSLGLASVLIALGIVVIHSGNMLEGRLDDRRLRFLPVLGALVVIGLGMFLLWQTIGQLG